MHGLAHYYKHVCALQFCRDRLHHGVCFLPCLPICGHILPLYLHILQWRLSNDSFVSLSLL